MFLKKLKVRVDIVYHPSSAGHGKGKGKAFMLVASHGRVNDSDTESDDDESMGPLAKLCPFNNEFQQSMLEPALPEGRQSSEEFSPSIAGDIVHDILSLVPFQVLYLEYRNDNHFAPFVGFEQNDQSLFELDVENVILLLHVDPSLDGYQFQPEKYLNYITSESSIINKY